MIKDTTLISSKTHTCEMCGIEFETKQSCKKSFVHKNATLTIVIG